MSHIFLNFSWGLNTEWSAKALKQQPPLDLKRVPKSWISSSVNSELNLYHLGEFTTGIRWQVSRGYRCHSFNRAKTRSPAGLQAPCALSEDQKCPHSGSGEQPHGKLLHKGTSACTIYLGTVCWGPQWSKLCSPGCNLSQPRPDVENRADESCPESVCFCWLQREPRVTSSAGNVCTVHTWDQVRETPHLPLLHLCFLPAAVTSQDKRPSQTPGLPNPALSCLNKWQRSAEWEFLQDFLVCKVKVNFEARLFYFSAVDKNSAEISELNERFLVQPTGRWVMQLPHSSQSFLLRLNSNYCIPPQQSALPTISCADLHIFPSWELLWG